MHERRHSERIIAFVMAGGEGSRLHPLTAQRCKPAVPFGTRYRIVDFVLSNLINSGIYSIYLLVQYKPQELIEHIRKGWAISRLMPEEFVSVVPPQMHSGTESFRGTADAVYQSLSLIETFRPDLVAVFGADHVYRMDVRQMVWFHREHQAQVTVAALPVPLDCASNFGIIDTDANGRISAFQEKPCKAEPMPSDPTRAYASMGNYLFDTDLLIEALREAHLRHETDFGQHVLPRMVANHRLLAYDFTTNAVPGLKPWEETGYWRDVGTIDAYFDAHRDALGEQPRFEVFCPQWPIYSSNYQGPAAKILGGDIDNSAFGAACLVHKGATIRNSIIRREALVEKDVVLDDCVIMDYARLGRGSRLRRVIVDRHNVIEPGTVIGYDPVEDAKRYHVTPRGVVVLPRGDVSFFARNSRGNGPGYVE